MRKYVDGVCSDMTENEVKQTEQIQISEEIRLLKQQLSETDYIAIKFAEGQLSEAEYADVKTERQKRREKIRELSKIGGAVNV
ncbi:MAG: hypothetical protein NC122_10070 [Faecalibacterium sp.]|nr:hypothetical protein [Ruminococcus sp.]MCM1392599.1 hypothetical protein [Ruminococcus sp.]MCM1486536.1 hypothetical protein [Faecalibacterium sp.]